MKLDCVVTYYRRMPLWRKVRGGLNKNKAHINELLVVNDEPWDGATSYVIRRGVRFPVTCLDHPHDDNFGLARSNNEGIEAAKTEYVVVLDDDIVLAPQALEKMLPFLRPGRLVYGRIVNAREDQDTSLEPIGPLLASRCFLGTGEEKTPLSLLLSQCCGGFFIIHKESHDQMGGYNEDLTERGYLDTDYALRWLLTFGPEKVGLGNGYAWHVDLQDRIRGEKNCVYIQRLYTQVLEAYPNLKMKDAPV
jgi:GT2 family glycosyltransferase